MKNFSGLAASFLAIVILAWIFDSSLVDPVRRRLQDMEGRIFELEGQAKEHDAEIARLGAQAKSEWDMVDRLETEVNRLRGIGPSSIPGRERDTRGIPRGRPGLPGPMTVPAPDKAEPPPKKTSEEEGTPYEILRVDIPRGFWRPLFERPACCGRDFRD